MTTKKITCPNCTTEIDVDDILSNQLKEQYKQEFTQEMSIDKAKMQTQFEAFVIRENAFKEKEKDQEKFIKASVDSKLKQEKEVLENELKTKLDVENSERISSMEKELNEKSEQLKELYQVRSEVEKIKREKNELKDAINAESEIKLSQQLLEQGERIKKQEQEKNELKFKELEKQLEVQKILTDEMARKQQQGSMQLQGEVQELGIEEWLTSKFPLDTITEIKKGERGADCMQTVHSHQRQNCGTIYYESKRTKEFGTAWIEKFKNDIREKGANVGVLVSEVYPKGMERVGLVDGVWVCSFEEFKGLSFVLREGIIQMSIAVSSQDNKGEKMVMLYNFLISNEFRLQVEGIVEGFTQMQSDLNTEKRSIQGHWKKREKQLEKVLLNTNHMYNSIRGIAGNEIQAIKTLELPEPIEDEIEE
ncbi:MAG: DUF2130 domain-containing protein [Flavobacteriaceae bacterium]|nr:DUF2130 domain-containing protein [Flavobacteriaceae bacterium]